MDADGLDWRKALSDNNSSYLEVQAGLFRNQETYAFLEPRQVISFSEYWMPVRGIGGISRANLAGVASLVRRGSGLMAGFNANQPIPQASVSILNRKQELFHEKVNLTPEHTWLHELPNAEPQARYTIEVQDAKGATLLHQTEGEYDWIPESEIHLGSQPSYQVPEAAKRSNDDWIQLGREDELNGRNLHALEIYKEALTRFPDSFSVGKAAGRLAAGLLRFEEAKAFLEPLHLRDTSDTEISYYLGVAYDGLGEQDHARAAYEQAERLPVYHSAAALRLGELLARKFDLASSLRHLSDAVQTAPEDVRAYEELVALKNSMGASDDAKALAEKGMARFPLSYLLREEAGTPDLNQLANDANRLLSLAAEFMRLGLYERALGVLARKYPPAVGDQTEPGALAPGEHPLVAYFRGYCREKLGQPGADDYAAASRLSTMYVFPSTAEELAVLRAALQSRPLDATAHYLLGTFYFSRGLTDSALSEWAEARKFAPELPVLSASTGMALLQVKNDPAGALAAFREGLQSDPTNMVVYTGMDQALSLLNRPARERVEALEKYPKLESAPPGLIFELILNLAEAGDFEHATSLFRNRFFAREEGGTNVRQVWVEVQLQRGLALAQAGRCRDALSAAQNLGAEIPDLAFTHDGLDPIVKSARTSYGLGSLYATCRKTGEANAKFAAAASASSPDQVRWAWLASQKLPGFDREKWRQTLQSALEQAASRNETSAYPGWWFYTAGSLERELGREQDADLDFRRALLLPDRMLSYHFTRLARSHSTP